MNKNRRHNLTSVDTPFAPRDDAVRKIFPVMKRCNSKLDEIAGEIIREQAYVRPFENVLNVGPSKRAHNGDADKHQNGVEIRVEATAKSRLLLRHDALLRRKHSSIASLFFAIVGILLMIVLNEWTFNATIADDDLDNVLSGYGFAVAQAIRSLLVVSTVALLASISAYHVSNIQIYMYQNGVDDWRIVMTPTLVVKVLIELVICCICPIPGNFYFWWWTEHFDGVTVTKPRVPVDILLSIPMFFRFYLVARVLHRCFPVFNSTRTKVVTSMNRVQFTLGFVVKSLAILYPAMSLLVFVVTYVMAASYVVRLCERYHYLGSNKTVIAEAKQFTNYLNSVWYIGVTFLTVGYGDIVVNTYCGRAVSILTGMIGIALTALIINVVASKMRLSCGESRVFEFIGSNSLNADWRRAAANVIRETWYIHKHKKLAATHDSKLKARDDHLLRRIQRRFLKALKEFRRMENLRLEAADARSSDLTDLCERNHNEIESLREETSKSLDDLRKSQQACNASLEKINAQLSAIHHVLYALTNQKTATLPAAAQNSLESR